MTVPIVFFSTVCDAADANKTMDLSIFDALMDSP